MSVYFELTKTLVLLNPQKFKRLNKLRLTVKSLGTPELSCYYLSLNNRWNNILNVL